MVRDGWTRGRGPDAVRGGRDDRGGPGAPGGRDDRGGPGAPGGRGRPAGGVLAPGRGGRRGPRGGGEASDNRDVSRFVARRKPTRSKRVRDPAYGPRHLRSGHVIGSPATARASRVVEVLVRRD